MSLEHHSLLHIEIYRVHLCLLSHFTVHGQFVLRHVCKSLLLVFLEQAHELERVCRLCLLILDHHHIDVRPGVFLVVVAQELAHLVCSVLMHNDIEIEDAVHLEILELVSHDGSVRDGQARHRVAIQLSRDSLGRGLVHNGCLHAYSRCNLRLQIWRMQTLLMWCT